MKILTIWLFKSRRLKCFKTFPATSNAGKLTLVLFKNTKQIESSVIFEQIQTERQFISDDSPVVDYEFVVPLVRGICYLPTCPVPCEKDF